MNRRVDYKGTDASRAAAGSIASAPIRAFGRVVVSSTAIVCALLASIASNAFAADPDRPRDEAIRAAVERSLPLIQATGAKYRAERECFSCHHQAVPAIALEIAAHRGFAIDRSELKAQGKHAVDDLARNAKGYREGKGQGGGVVRAGYALWTISVAGIERDETTSAVVHYLLVHDETFGYWKTSSHRPPSEESDFTATGVALIGLARFAQASDRSAFESRKNKAIDWLESRKPKDAEDRVFKLWGLKFAGANRAAIDSAVQDLIQYQRADGGWGQTDDRSSDAYATGSALVALSEAGDLKTDNHSYIKGLAYLLRTQLADGSWLVKSRSRPFQTYFESGFPHGDDQFISTAATSWAVAALALALPNPESPELKIAPDRTRSQTGEESARDQSEGERR